MKHEHFGLSCDDPKCMQGEPGASPQATRTNNGSEYVSACGSIVRTNEGEVTVSDNVSRSAAQPAAGTTPLEPGASLLVKLGSIAVHAEEILSPNRHQFDMSALQTLLDDAEVKEWLKKMDKMAFLPVKR